MTGFLIWTGLGVVVIAFNVLYRLWLRKKRNDGRPVRTLSTNERIVMAVIGGVLLLAGVVALLGR